MVWFLKHFELGCFGSTTLEGLTGLSTATAQPLLSSTHVSMSTPQGGNQLHNSTRYGMQVSLFFPPCLLHCPLLRSLLRQPSQSPFLTFNHLLGFSSPLRERWRQQAKSSNQNPLHGSKLNQQLIFFILQPADEANVPSQPNHKLNLTDQLYLLSFELLPCSGTILLYLSQKEFDI